MSGRWLVVAAFFLSVFPGRYVHAGATVRETLADASYRFCHDEAYRLDEHEAAWCPLLPEDASACPAFVAACGNPRATSSGGGGGFARGARSEGGGGGEGS